MEQQELFKSILRIKTKISNFFIYLRVFGVLIHGDAAVAGQGIVYESLEMQDLVDYSTGGIIHIVMNNQIGFTTNPNQSRSSYYCT